MKKASLLIAFLFCIASAQTNTCFSQSTAAGHWQLIQGDPFPDSVTQIVAGPGSLVYMATSDKGVFKSTDEGENWTEINTGLNGDLAITMLALGPNGDLLARDSYGNILYSKDAAKWTSDAVPWYWQYPGASAKAFAFDSNGAAYVGTVGAGIYKMDSLGKWDQVLSPDIIPGVQAMLFDNQNRLVVHYDKLYRLKSDFSVVDTSWPITNTGNNPAQLIKTKWGSMLVVSDTLYELTDQLQTIYRNNGGIIADSIGNLYSYYDANSIWDYMEKSTDRGATWNTAKIPSVSNIPYYGRFVEATSQGFITDGAGQPGLSVSFDTAFGFISIHELDENLKINNIYVDPSQTLQVFDAAGGIWSSSDHGGTWLLRVNRNHIQGQLMEDGKYYAFNTFHDSVFVSDDGLSYSQINLPAGVGRPALYASPNGTLWLTYGAERFMRSTDNGVTWNDFAHFTDPAPPAWHLDSGGTWGMIQRGQNIWFATLAAIHFTSDDGATWQVDTPDYFEFNGISGGKGNSIIALSDGNGIHWLNPGENVDSGWLQEDGTYAQDLDGTMVQIALPWYPEDPQSFVRESKSGVILDTLCILPDSLSFQNVIDQDFGSAMSIDSSGNIFAAATGGASNNTFGLYRFISATASVTPQPTLSTDLDVSVTNNTLTITSSGEIQSAEMIDVTGRSLIEIPSSHSTTLSASVASISSGFYFVKTETVEGTIVRKVMIVR